MSAVDYLCEKNCVKHLHNKKTARLNDFELCRYTLKRLKLVKVNAIVEDNENPQYFIHEIKRISALMRFLSFTSLRQ